MHRSRLRLLLISGAIIMALGVGARLLATDTLSVWRAKRMANEQLARAAADQDASYPVLLEWARRLEASGRLPEAARVYHRAAEQRPTSAEAWTGWGRSLYSSGDWKQADELLRKTVEQFPDHAEGRFAFAALLASTFRYQAAREELLAGLKHRADLPDSWIALGEVETRLKNPAGALKAFQRARNLDPRSIFVQGRLGQSLVETGRIKEGQRELESALRADPSDSDVRFHLATALVATGVEDDRVRGFQELSRVVEFSNQKTRGYIEAARVWIREGNPRDAIPALERAIDVDRHNVDALEMLINCYRRENRTAEAARFEPDLEKSRQLKARLEAAEARLASAPAAASPVSDLLVLGDIALEAQQLAQAQQAYLAAGQLDKGNPRAVRGLETVAKLSPKNTGETAEADAAQTLF